MARLESAAWPLAFGGASVFVLAVVLDRLPWQAATVAVAAVIIGWSWHGPVIVGVALGVIGWLCVTGFDVHRFGYIGVTGGDDVVRGALLVFPGVLTGAVRAATGAVRRRRTDPLWVAFHEADREPDPRPDARADPRREEGRRDG